MSVSESDLVERMAKISVSPVSLAVMLAALRSGGGRMTQFSHADLGGMSQWSPGMTMVGDMFNKPLNAKLDALCSDLAAHLSIWTVRLTNMARPKLLRCELAAVGYLEAGFGKLRGGVGYLAIFKPPMQPPSPSAITPC